MADIFQGWHISKSALFFGVSSSKTNAQGYMRDAAPVFAETHRATLRSKSHLSLSFDNYQVWVTLKTQNGVESVNAGEGTVRYAMRPWQLLWPPDTAVHYTRAGSELEQFCVVA